MNVQAHMIRLCNLIKLIQILKKLVLAILFELNLLYLISVATIQSIIAILTTICVCLGLGWWLHRGTLYSKIFSFLSKLINIKKS